jgi:3-oxoacyl-[acyl-carrier-protein] synthase III
VLGVGTYVPQRRAVAELAAKAGGDASGYEGWPQVGVAIDDEHPSTMGAAALTDALREARIGGEDLKLVLACGVSRDYLPSWSLAHDIMGRIGATRDCFGLDLTVGCLGALAGLEVAGSWLRAHDGGYAAIVTAERWNYTVNYAERRNMGLWGHADGASAAVVAIDTKGLAVYRGSSFSSEPRMNGYIVIESGGTRQPVAPPGEDPRSRRLADKPKGEVMDSYVGGYMRAFAALHRTCGGTADALICNQISPGVTKAISAISGVPLARTVITGDERGHVGSADIFLGIRKLLDAGGLPRRTYIAGSAPCAYGAGLLEAG